MIRIWILALITAFMLTACNAGDTGDSSDGDNSAQSASDAPAEAIENYLQARVASDVDGLREYSCADWESQVTLEANSFRGREAQLQDMSCSTRETADGEGVVECEGVITASYQGEQSEFELGNYRVVEEDGAWKMCGEAE